MKLARPPDEIEPAVEMRGRPGAALGGLKKKVGKHCYSPRFTGSKPVQFRLASLTVIIFWGGRWVGNAYAEAVLPNMALIALDEKAVRRIGLVIVTTLVLLVTADTSRDLVFL